MDSGPAVFAGAVFTAFGAGLMLWTGARAAHGLPVAEGVRQSTATVVGGCFGLATGLAGLWMLLSG
ncbi:hypothetical protein [Streptomyces sp. NPDC054784]